jgi:XTP/dITP diphosphohydrolase
MRLTFVSTNGGKYREVRAVLREYGVAANWSRQSLPEMQSAGLEEVVREKLEEIRRVRGYGLVEDSGLFLPGLRGFPGVYSAYVYDTIGLEGVLRLLRGRSRKAVFQTVAGLRHGGRRWFFVGRCRGRIADRERGSGGFGYDPIFIPENTGRTFAEMTFAEKNQRSHRARAIRKVGEFLRTRAERTGA